MESLFINGNLQMDELNDNIPEMVGLQLQQYSHPAAGPLTLNSCRF